MWFASKEELKKAMQEAVIGFQDQTGKDSKALSLALGMSSTYITQIRNGTVMMGLWPLVRLADLCGTGVDAILGIAPHPGDVMREEPFHAFICAVASMDEALRDEFLRKAAQWAAQCARDPLAQRRAS